MRAIDSFPSSTGPGCFGLRPEHIKDIIEADSGENLLDVLTHLVNHLLSGSAPDCIAPLIPGANLFALPKKDGSVHPVAGVITNVSNVHGIEFNHWYLDDRVISGSPRVVAHAPVQSNYVWIFVVPLRLSILPGFLIREILPKLLVEIEIVAKLPEPQSAYLLLNHCSSAPKVGHLMRTIPPSTIREFTSLFDSSVLRTFENMTATQLNTNAKIPSSTPRRLRTYEH
ncbi:hypothetical protein GJ496_005266 [Pomphorhynchus laevis]|nr:hypothetical protein GJ496_005266 [Pomphorhynchus laevis]